MDIYKEVFTKEVLKLIEDSTAHNGKDINSTLVTFEIQALLKDRVGCPKSMFFILSSLTATLYSVIKISKTMKN